MCIYCYLLALSCECSRSGCINSLSGPGLEEWLCAFRASVSNFVSSCRRAQMLNCQFSSAILARGTYRLHTSTRGMDTLNVGHVASVLLDREVVTVL